MSTKQDCLLQSPKTRTVAPPFPFVEPQRDNFPRLDEALPLPLDQGATPKMARNKTPQSSPPDFLLDHHSTCSSAQETSTSIMDMSIGARAELTEHLRSIARFGIDGSPPNPNTNVDTSLQQKPPNHRDEEWEKALNCSQISWASTVVDDSTGNASSYIHKVHPAHSVWEDGTEGVEVLADVSSDYFNSSRVNLLATPEKNKSRIRRIETQRGADAHRGYDDSDIGSVPSQDAALAHMFQAAMDMCEQQQQRVDSSFASFTAIADISRISNGSDVSDTRPSPDDSFQRLARDSLPLVQMTPSRSSAAHQNGSFFSPLRSPPFSASSRPSSFLSPCPRTTNRSSDKENGPNLSFIGLSPIAAKAGSEARLQRKNQKDRTTVPFPEFEMRPSGALDGLVTSMGSLRSESHLPDTSSSSDNNPNFDPDASLSVDRVTSSNSRPNPSSSSGGYRGDSSNSEKAGSSSSSSVDLSNRRRYRTVVPARVFMKEPNDFPLHNDSFSTPSNAAGTTSSETADFSEEAALPSKSLEASFDDVYEAPNFEC